MQSIIQSQPIGVNDKLEFVITPQNAILFEIDDDELYYKGNLYDLVNTKQKADTLYISCLQDYDETALINNYGNACFSNIQQKHQGSENSIHSFYSFYEIVNLDLQICDPELMQMPLLQLLDNHSYKALFAVLKPPPKQSA